MTINQESSFACLRDIFANVNQWLHFLEAKNAALIMFSVSLYSMIPQNAFSFQGNHITLVSFLSFVSALLIFISIIISLFSFMPQKNLPDGSTTTDKSKINHLFYSDISTCKQQEYKESLLSLYGLTDIRDHKMASDYIQEIVINARVAERKHTLFTCSLYCTIFSTIFIAVICMFSK